MGGLAGAGGGGQSDVSLDDIKPSIDFDLVSETSKILELPTSSNHLSIKEEVIEPIQQQLFSQEDPRHKIKVSLHSVPPCDGN